MRQVSDRVPLLEYIGHNSPNLPRGGSEGIKALSAVRSAENLEMRREKNGVSNRVASSRITEEARASRGEEGLLREG
ncbi:hypothetical protein GB937_009607 [Aspergillus fischeri]|nr:hypothetical protein GB937_009607 [Aspergillus fischeri]